MEFPGSMDIGPVAVDMHFRCSSGIAGREKGSRIGWGN